MKKIAYLTFDDGPTENAQTILDILGDIRATFFPQGNKITEEYKPFLKKLYDDGHYLGLHSMTHDHETLYSNAQNFLDEMLEEQAILEEITGHKSTLYRPPFGSPGNFTEAHIELMKNSGLRCWDWHTDTKDWDPTVTVEDILTKVKDYVEEHNGPSPMVILMHELFQPTFDALPTLIEYLKEQGYEFKAYSEDEHFEVNLIGVEGL